MENMLFLLVLIPQLKYMILIKTKRFIVLLMPIKVFNLQSFLLKIIEAIQSLALSKDNKYLVTSGYDKVVKVWDFKSKEPVHEFVTNHKSKF